MKKTMYTLTTIFVVSTFITTILYKTTHLALLLSLAITLGTCSYHFVMRLVVGTVYHNIFHNRVDYTRSWFVVRPWENTLYKKLKVKKWKDHMPTYSPDTFDLHTHSIQEIAMAMCQSELVHETIVILSFVPILAGKYFGASIVFIMTSILAAMIDSSFVILQRYNRARIVKILKKKQ